MGIADAILLRCGSGMARVQWKEMQALGRQAGAKALRGYTAAELAYAFFELAPARQVGAAELAAFAAQAGAVMKAGEVKADALRQVQSLAGAAAGSPAPVHYIVEMDFAPGAEAEAARWYAEEHLPGLAAVPGCVQARRYLSESGRSYACYDLRSERVPQSPEWLRWRDTEWITRLRPQFRGLQRHIFATL